MVPERKEVSRWRSQGSVKMKRTYLIKRHKVKNDLMRMSLEREQRNKYQSIHSVNTLPRL